jgi:hypothetical protein
MKCLNGEKGFNDSIAAHILFQTMDVLYAHLSLVFTQVFGTRISSNDNIYLRLANQFVDLARQLSTCACLLLEWLPDIDHSLSPLRQGD